MRRPPLPWVVLAALLLPGAAAAQSHHRVKIEKVRVGFQSAGQEEGGGTFKPGLWTPVHVTLVRSPDGDVPLTVGADDSVEFEVLVQTADGDGVGTIYPQKSGRIRKQDRIEVLTYVKAASTNPEVRVSVRVGDATYGGFRANPTGLQLHEHLYLTLGARLKGVFEGLLELRGNRKENKERLTSPRHVAHETEVSKLPTVARGYDGVDLVILTTENDAFMKELTAERNADRVKALADWVRRGGRLVVSASWVNQPRLHSLLGPTYWEPALPPLVAEASPAEHVIKTFHTVETWAGIQQKHAYFPRPDTQRVALLTRDERVEVVTPQANEPPLIVSTPYGLGRVTVLAFEVEKGRFDDWGGEDLEKDKNGKVTLRVAMGAATFWKELLTKLAPRAGNPREGFEGGRGQRGADLTTELSRQLEVFDSPPIGFGWVALFILIYILIVGPLDYFILKKVFKRLELTWITFPTVVLTISLIAYLTAHAIKGKELKVNKVDLLDIDQRTDLQRDPKTGAIATARARVYGTSWFTVLSPRIESYSIGLEPVFPTMMGADPKDTPKALVSWLGRPDRDDMGGMGRPQSQGFFTRTYKYARDDAGLQDVSINVWTTKAFTAAWEAPLKKLPFYAKLHYEPGGDRQLFGTIKANLPRDVELTEVRLIYGNEFHSLPNLSAGGPAVTMEPERLRNGLTLAENWVHGQPQFQGGLDPMDVRGGTTYDPWTVVRELMFHEKTDRSGLNRNHAHRPLDFSWRAPAAWRDRDVGVREAILVGKLKRARGQAEELHQGDNPPLLTHLWLKDLPGEDPNRPGQRKQRPTLSGMLYQDTYVRVILPVTPAPAKQP